MASQPEVVVLSGARTSIGDYGSALKDFSPTDLAARVVREAVSRAKVDPNDVGHLVFGNVIHGEAKDMYLARVACINGGLPQATPALTLNRLCGSGLQAIVGAAQTILLGDAQCAVAGGAESMSRGAYCVPGLRWGQRMGDGGVVDMMVGALTDPFDTIHMGVTAENVAAKWGISRTQQDQFAVESHKRAVNAIQKGYFKEQILPIEIKTKKGTSLVDTDEHPRADASMEGMAKLRAVFNNDGSVTAGNASGINDGAAAVVVMSERKAKELGLTPLATIRACASAGVDPGLMGMGPWPASEKALARAKLRREEIDLWELNEAFAAQSLGVLRELRIPKNRVNVNGGAIALGHPIGASGTRILVTLLHEMKRRDAKRGLATLCIGGGQGIAMVVESAA